MREVENGIERSIHVGRCAQKRINEHKREKKIGFVCDVNMKLMISLKDMRSLQRK